jgi:hypothetical protein
MFQNMATVRRDLSGFDLGWVENAPEEIEQGLKSLEAEAWLDRARNEVGHEAGSIRYYIAAENAGGRRSQLQVLFQAVHIEVSSEAKLGRNRRDPVKGGNQIWKCRPKPQLARDQVKSPKKGGSKSSNLPGEYLQRISQIHTILAHGQIRHSLGLT